MYINNKAKIQESKKNRKEYKAKNTDDYKKHRIQKYKKILQNTIIQEYINYNQKMKS